MILDTEILKQIRSAEARKFQWVHEQSLDSSCGYASVATLLEVYWDVETSEQDLLAQVPPPSGERFSLSLADAKKMVEQAGLDARGYRMSWDQLNRVAAIHAPVLVHYDRPRKHFALLLGTKQDHVIVADPARGLEVLSRSDFEARWSGVALFVGSTLHARNTSALESAVEWAWSRSDRLETLALGPKGGHR